jgi:predicted HicB family RNase H-like nuclease
MFFYYTLNAMKAGRPKKTEENKQSEIIPIRVTQSEKAAFQLCADLAGISLSSWVRERLRLASIRELEGAGRRVPFVDEIPL